MNHVLDDKTQCDLECILDGYFSPLTTFMTEKNWKLVCESLRLETGDFFPLPINLAVDKNLYKLGDTVTLMDTTNYPIAKINIEDIYEPDIDFECYHAYGTTDTNHPYVSYKQAHKNKVYISGSLERINNVRHYDFKLLRIKPSQTREYFKKKRMENYSRISNKKSYASCSF